MSTETLRVLVVGTHPDDCDLKAGGVACKYAGRGHDVLFVSMTDGGAGHHELAGRELVRRRRTEAKAAAVAGVEFRQFDVLDSRLTPSLENRDRLVREFRPNLVLTHRPNDYHPDHRYTVQLVRDAAYLVAVPNVCPTTPALDENPVFAYLSDTFERPYPVLAGRGRGHRRRGPESSRCWTATSRSCTSVAVHGRSTGRRSLRTGRALRVASGQWPAARRGAGGRG